MGLGVRWLSAIALLVSLPMGGCTHGKELRRTSALPTGLSDSSKLVDSPVREPKLLVPPAPTGAAPDAVPAVLHATAWEESGTPGSIVQTAGIFDKPAEAVKQGVNKVTNAITPTPPVTPADDPTLLSTKSKPTPELHLSMARYQEELGKPAMAEQSYQQALRMAPKHLGAHMAYARFKERQGQACEALQLYQKAAKLRPNEAAVFNDMGLLYARHGMNAEAIAAYGRAIEIQPTRALYRNNMAVLLVDTGQPEQAMRQLTAVYPEADACYKLGYLLQAKGQTHQAIDSFSRALALKPSMKEPRAWLEHLRSDPAGEPRVARRPPGAGSASELPPPARRPDFDVKRDDPVVTRPLPDEQDPPQARRGSVRQLPPVLKPLPEPTLRPLPEPVPEAPPPPATGPVPWPRRLPPTSAERPAAHEEDDGDRAGGTRRLDDVADDLPDAPLPTASPRTNLLILRKVMQ